MWHPVVTVPAVGDLIQTIARPGVAIPLAVAVIALVVLTMLPSSGERSDDEPAADDARPTLTGQRRNSPTEEGPVSLDAAAGRAAP